LFSGPMVRAILDGSKTQTRRVAKDLIGFTSSGQPLTVRGGDPCEYARPYGAPGDRLWAREKFLEADSPRRSDGYGCPVYAADYSDSDIPNTRWRPSIHMPRWASRILLEIVSVRVERLQDISEADALAEGIDTGELCARQYLYDTGLAGSGADGRATPISMFKELWQSINGADSWDANPWVWVIEFRRLTP
jgi:hypothetical protein